MQEREIESRSLLSKVGGAARAVWEGNRPLALLAAGALGLVAFSLVAQLVDAREVLGAPTWMKPAKFAASGAVAAVAVAWIIGQMQGANGRRLAKAGRLMAIVLALELVAISIQAVRGVPSHFNVQTTANTVLFTAMGLGITLFWLAQGYVAVQAFRHDFASQARAWGIRLGLLGALLGGAIAFLMTAPTPAQQAEIAKGTPTLAGAHAVGVADGGPGLPVTRWSTAGGDLRVPHFWGLHALQALPLAALLLERRRRGARAVLGLGVAWIGLIGVLLAQALRGQPVSAPDGLTLGLAVLVLAVGALVGAPWPTRRTAAGIPLGTAPI